MESAEPPAIYRSCSPVIEVEYEVESDLSPTELIIEAVSTAAGVDPLDIPPLYEFVDPDTIDQLVGGPERATDSNTMLSFQLETWNVFVRADGRILVADSTTHSELELVFEPSVA